MSVPKPQSDRIIDEIIETEKTYKAGLKNLIENLINPLKRNEKLGKGKAKRLIELSKQIESILAISNVMLEDLLEAKNKAGADKQLQVANVFSGHAPLIEKLYGPYLTAYSEMLKIITQLKENKDYRSIEESFFGKMKQDVMSPFNHACSESSKVCSFAKRAF